LTALAAVGASILAGACSPLKTVQRRPPMSRVVVGGNSGSETAADGSESSGSLAQIAYVPGATRADDGGGWGWRPGISVQQWSIEESGDAPEVLFRDVELFFRQPDLLSGGSPDSRWFRLGAQVGTFWSDYKVDGLRASNGFTPGSSRWRAIPLLAYRGAIEPEALLMFGSSWEITAFASLHGAAGVAYPSSGGGDTSDAFYNPTSMVDYGYELGLRATFGPVFGQVSFQTRHLQGGSAAADSESSSGTTYPDVESESSTIEGVWLLLGVAF
jgi:hypothetical protein